MQVIQWGKTLVSNANIDQAKHAFYIKIYTKLTLYNIFKFERPFAWTLVLEISNSESGSGKQLALRNKSFPGQVRLLATSSAQ